MGGLTLVELPAHAAAVLLVVQGAEDVDGFMDAYGICMRIVNQSEDTPKRIGTESVFRPPTWRAPSIN